VMPNAARAAFSADFSAAAALASALAFGGIAARAWRLPGGVYARAGGRLCLKHSGPVSFSVAMLL
jgi:hypothetical protein